MGKQTIAAIEIPNKPGMFLCGPAFGNTPAPEKAIEAWARKEGVAIEWLQMAPGTLVDRLEGMLAGWIQQPPDPADMISVLRVLVAIERAEQGGVE